MPAKNFGGEYEKRIRRTDLLASVHPFAHEVLQFYKKIAEFQKNLRARIALELPASNELASFRELLHVDSALPHFPEFLKVVAESAPITLAEAAHEVSAERASVWRQLLLDYWNTSGRNDSPNAAFEQFLPRAFLQPYAEQLSSVVAKAEAHDFPSLCPLCGARPLLGVMRPEGDGGKRFLLCSFCLQEWEFRRIFCATCGEDTEAKLPVYVAEQFPYMRVDACETCKFYLRTIDLTKDGNAVPLVDDLAAIPLSLWAEERGYSRAQPNLLGS
jgi:FdhE protein